MKIGPIDLNERVLIVAEIGNNHEGNYAAAERLVREAAACGVDAVKFQTFRADRFQSPRTPERFERLRGFELRADQFAGLAQLARSLGLLFLSTPLDLESVAVLEPLVDAFKIASGDNTFYPLIARVCRTGKPLLISSGFCDLDTIAATHEFIRAEWRRASVNREAVVLHCVSSYPVPPEQAQLRAIGVLRDRLNTVIGYSDHTLGIEACQLAVAAGARVIEKHFTTDHAYSGFRDHQLSADPDEMTVLVKRVREIERWLGRAEKTVQEGERAILEACRRSIAAADDLDAGRKIDPTDLIWVRPGGGLAPGSESSVVGKRLRRRIAKGHPILAGDVE